MAGYGVVDKVEILRLGDIRANSSQYISTGLRQLDTMLGGGLVKGAVYLLSAKPGAGKSTLTSQLADHYSKLGYKSLIISGEETLEQCKGRMDRLGLVGENVFIMKAPTIEQTIEQIRKLKPDLFIFDSIQTARAEEIKSMPGNPSQIKHCAKELTNITKALGITSIIVGHVTKRNDIAGPKALEHIIDCTWFMDRNPIDDTIVARTMKNRFGPTDKVAMLRMTPQGLDEVSDVELREMYQDRTIAIVEQSGELMGCELQCSIRRTSMPRHNILGYDVKRFRAILSIIKKHTGLTFESHEINLDVYPTLESNKEVELSLACAIISCYLGLNRRNVCYIGELLMDGSIRPVEHANILKDYANRIGKEGRDQYAHLQELIDEEFVKYIT